MSEEKTVTEREAVLRERHAYMKGVVCERARLPFTETEVWVADRNRLYPLPVRRRPIRAELSDGSRWEMRGGGIYHAVSDHFEFRTLAELADHARTADDFEGIAKILRGETEEVPEGEE